MGMMIYGVFVSLPLAGAVLQQNTALEVSLGIRQWALLGNSLKLGLAVTALDLLLGFFCALYISGSKRFFGWKKYYFIIMLPIPFYIYALSWVYLLKVLALFWPEVAAYSLAGLGACIFVETLAFLPISILFLLVGMENIDPDKLRLASLYGDGNRAVWSVVIPSAAPYGLAAAGLICILSMTEFSVPSMFQYNTYALDLFSVYSRTGSALTAYIQCVPLMLVLILPVFWLLGNIRAFGLKGGIRSRYLLKTTGVVRFLGRMAFAVSLLQIGMPVAVLLITSGGFQSILSGCGMVADELFTSFWTAFWGAGFCVLFAAGPAIFLGKRGRRIAWIILYTIVIPGGIQAMGLLKIVNRSGMIWLEKSLLLISLGCALKFAPFLILWLYVTGKRADLRSLEMAEILAVRKSDPAKIRLRIFAPSYLAGFGMAFFLTFAEESIPLILMAPGRETITVKIYNYLHYGASEYVSAFSLAAVLFLFLMEGMLVLGCWLFLGKGRRAALK